LTARLLAPPGGDPLASVRELVTREPDITVVLAGTARTLTEVLAADGCLIYRAEPNGDLVAACCHPPPAPGGEQLRLPRGFGVTGRVAADAVAVALADDSPRNQRHRELLGLRAGERVSRLCVPARAPGGGCVAVVAVHERAHREFSAAEITLGQAAGDLLGLRLTMEKGLAEMAGYRAEWDGLVAATVAAQEAERRRVAADLHDGVSQAIAGLAFHLSAAAVAIQEGDLGYADARVRAARGLADLAVAETRSAITGLHSPVIDDLGLAAGLVSMARAVPNLTVDVDAQDLQLPEPVVVSLFRVAQEAVQNVVKHAEATRAEVRLVRHGRSVVLTVADNGCGFEAPGELSGSPGGGPARTRYGLAGMAERVHLIGGRLRVTSQAGAGTTVEATVPVG
jgi:two-component system, NarL family, sensor kinase